MNALREAFDSERAWLRACSDQRAVLDRMAAYRDDLATARRLGNGDAYALAERLVELAEDRLTVLKVEAHRARQQKAAPSIPAPIRPIAPATPPEAAARPVGASVRGDEGKVVGRLQSELAASREALQRASRKRDEAEQRARRASEERETAAAREARPTHAETGMGALRVAPSSPAHVAVPFAAPRVATASGRVPVAPPRIAPSAPATVRPTSVPPTMGRPGPVLHPVTRPAGGAANDAPRAPVNVPTPVPGSPTRDETPALTGADLAAFRRRERLTQVAAAQRLGVAQGTISKAEGNPRAVLGATLADALRRACG